MRCPRCFIPKFAGINFVFRFDVHKPASYPLELGEREIGGGNEVAWLSAKREGIINPGYRSFLALVFPNAILEFLIASPNLPDYELPRTPSLSFIHAIFGEHGLNEYANGLIHRYLPEIDFSVTKLVALNGVMGL